MDVADAIAKCGGVARTSQLLDLGITNGQIRHARRTAQMIRVRQGVYAIERTHAAVAAAHGGAVSCVSALIALGVWILCAPAQLHIAIGRGQREFPHASCLCIVHRVAKHPPFGATSVRQAFYDARACLTPEFFFVAFESAWNRGLLTARDRAWLRAHLPVALRRVCGLARSDAASGLESLLRFRLHALGYALRSQVTIPAVGRVDFVVGRLIIEVDGRLGHADAPSRHKDLRRDAMAAAAGYRTLRFDYALVVHEWPVVQRAILAAIHSSD